MTDKKEATDALDKLFVINVPEQKHYLEIGGIAPKELKQLIKGLSEDFSCSYISEKEMEELREKAKRTDQRAERDRRYRGTEKYKQTRSKYYNNPETVEKRKEYAKRASVNRKRNLITNTRRAFLTELLNEPVLKKKYEKKLEEAMAEFQNTVDNGGENSANSVSQEDHSDEGQKPNTPGQNGNENNNNDNKTSQ